MQKKLRAHHLLCIPLYEGKGYSEKFNCNMKEMIELLHNKGTQVEIIREPDIICSECPNLLENGTCRNGRNGVVEKDLYLMEALNLPTGILFSYIQLQKLVKERMTRKIFDGACQGCTWKKAGVCSYDKLRMKLEENDMETTFKRWCVADCTTKE